MKIHIVQKGDTLWKIAKKYGVNFEELKKMNSQLSNPDMIMPGMKVKVPTSGGMVKKETPKVGSNPGATINLGAKKEMPIAEHPFTKEKPMPIVEAPVKEAPMQPILKETPKAPYIPKMPQPVVPEIDINNYYMLNMANMSVQQPQPQFPPTPASILPEAKEVPKKPESPESPESPIQMPIQGGVEQPMYPQYCVPISPVMPGPGFNYPWGYPQQPVMPYAPVQGGMMAQNPGMVPANPAAMPAYPTAVPGTGAPGYMPYYHADESSSFMPQMPQMAQQMPMMGQQMPGQQMPMMGQQMPMTGQQMYYPRMEKGPKEAPIMQQPIMQPAPQPIQAPIMQPAPAPAPVPAAQPVPAPVPQPLPAQMPVEYAQVPFVPYGDQCYPVSPIMPGPGFGNPGMGYPYGQMPYNLPQMGPQQVQGVMESMDSSNIPMGYPQMGGMQMPMGVNPQMAGMPVNPDCGCGGVAPQPVPQTYMPGTPQVYSPPYSGQMGQPPLINPYGMGPMGTAPYGMPRYHDEGSEYDD